MLVDGELMHSEDFLKTVSEIAQSLEHLKVEMMVNELARCRNAKGRVYIIGLGGSLANATHMASDLRKLCDIDAYSPDNMAEFTARANDEGMHTVFTGWIREITQKDILFVLSVGGGTERVSQGITEAVKKAKGEGAKVLGIVGPYGGATADLGDVVIRIASTNPTPFTEAFQAVIWHCVVIHPSGRLGALPPGQRHGRHLRPVHRRMMSYCSWLSSPSTCR